MIWQHSADGETWAELQPGEPALKFMRAVYEISEIPADGRIEIPLQELLDRGAGHVPPGELDKAIDALQSQAHRADDLFLRLHGDASPVEPVAWRVVCADGAVRSHDNVAPYESTRKEAQDTADWADTSTACPPGHRVEPLYVAAPVAVEPVAWFSHIDKEFRFTSKPKVAEEWRALGRQVTSLYEREG